MHTRVSLIGSTYTLQYDVALQYCKTSARFNFFAWEPCSFFPELSALVPLLCKQTGLVQMNEGAAFLLAWLKTVWTHSDLRFTMFADSSASSSYLLCIVSQMSWFREYTFISGENGVVAKVSAHCISLPQQRSSCNRILKKQHSFWIAFAAILGFSCAMSFEF